jgi:hypothetical protein
VKPKNRKISYFLINKLIFLMLNALKPCILWLFMGSMASMAWGQGGVVGKIISVHDKVLRPWGPLAAVGASVFFQDADNIRRFLVGSLGGYAAALIACHWTSLMPSGLGCPDDPLQLLADWVRVASPVIAGSSMGIYALGAPADSYLAAILAITSMAYFSKPNRILMERHFGEQGVDVLRFFQIVQALRVTLPLVFGFWVEDGKNLQSIYYEDFMNFTNVSSSD